MADSYVIHTTFTSHECCESLTDLSYRPAASAPAPVADGAAQLRETGEHGPKAVPPFNEHCAELEARARLVRPHGHAVSPGCSAPVLL